MTLIPAGTQTYSKAANQRPAIAPQLSIRGEGARVLCGDWEEHQTCGGLGCDGCEWNGGYVVERDWYVDWSAALGPIVLGYQNAQVDAAAHQAVDDGPNFGLPTAIERRLAARLRRIIPCAEAVKFGKHGSDPTSAAIRAARALTGRDLIISSGYHGWTLEVGGGPNKAGVPAAAQALVVEDAEYDNVAAIIAEPDAIVNRMMGNAGALEILRGACDRFGMLLIFDEVLTGFRLHLGGAQAFYGVTPDLACFSKAMGNGYSVSAVVGTKEAMAPFGGGVGYSMTFAGETIGLAAAAATIDFMEAHPVIDHLWRIGRQLQDGWNAIALRHGLPFTCEGDPPRTVINWHGDMAAKTLVQQEMWKRGQMWTVGFTPTYAHGDADVDHALEAAEAALRILAENRDDPARAVDGPIVGEVFRR